LSLLLGLSLPLWRSSLSGSRLPGRLGLAARRSGALSLPWSVRIVSLVTHDCRRSVVRDRLASGTTNLLIKPEAGTGTCSPQLEP